MLSGEAVTRMMYGFGDHESPANDTVHVMEDLLGHFVTDLVRPAPSFSRPILASARSCR